MKDCLLVEYVDIVCHVTANENAHVCKRHILFGYTCNFFKRTLTCASLFGCWETVFKPCGSVLDFVFLRMSFENLPEVKIPRGDSFFLKPTFCYLMISNWKDNTIHLSLINNCLVRRFPVIAVHSLSFSVGYRHNSREISATRDLIAPIKFSFGRETLRDSAHIN